MKMMIMMMMVEMTNQFFIYLLIQRGQVQRQHKYKDRKKTIEENSKDRTKNKIKKHHRHHHHHHQGGKNTGGQVAVANKFCR
jgi:hypothetical protein